LADQNRVQEWKKALLTGKPIVAGIDLPAAYEKAMVRASTDGGRLGPSHAVAILGYRDSEHAFIVQDSRGPDWFLGGQWWMPYAFAESGFVYRAYSFNFK
jgi:C1A family cysteine protease